MAANMSEEKIEIIDQEKSIATPPIEEAPLDPEQEPHIHFKTILIVFVGRNSLPEGGHRLTKLGNLLYLFCPIDKSSWYRSCKHHLTTNMRKKN
jgi:hypothetical protein